MPLPLSHPQCLTFAVEVIQAQGAKFLIAQGRGVEHFQHGPITNALAVCHVGGLQEEHRLNGDARAYPGGAACQAAGFTVCPHTAVPIYHIDETAMTATLVFDDVLSQYSNFGGNITALANGNVEFDLCSDTTAPGGISAAFEVTRTATPQVVWKLNVTTKNAYRTFRMPSLYPGVQW